MLTESFCVIVYEISGVDIRKEGYIGLRMSALPQYTYIFALGVIFAFLDAFNIGANDVANAFSTSVSSRSLTLRQAALIATFCEVQDHFSHSLTDPKVSWGTFVRITSCRHRSAKN
jgi:hypothetical protein